ncbi:tetratricopeptide repeat protein [Candidatus Falkowbacteria bacterium]|nr:tetratricopeptide repeat protein [Candidatus Falkowbacteria bacterium]
MFFAGTRLRGNIHEEPHLAVLQQAKNDFAAAERDYQEALQIRRELARSNPQTYLPDVAMTLINLGLFYQRSVPDKEKSLNCLAEALRTLKHLIAKLPYTQKYQATALSCIQAWGVDPEKFLKTL